MTGAQPDEQVPREQSPREQSPREQSPREQSPRERSTGAASDRGFDLGNLADRPNVILTGFMGTGKSTVGRALARVLDYDFVDTDVLIEHDHGPIPHIFATEGEAAFRRYEQEVASALSSSTGKVIATGGRLMLDPHNADALGTGGLVFALTASVEEILRRVRSDDGSLRPLIAGDDPPGRVRALLAERTPLYARFTTIDTNGRSANTIARDIAGRVRGALADHRALPDRTRSNNPPSEHHDD